MLNAFVSPLILLLWPGMGLAVCLLLGQPGVHAALPVGSLGVGAEAETLAKESGLKAGLAAGAQAKLPDIGLPVQLIGRLV